MLHPVEEGQIEVVPATLERWPDVELIFGSDGDIGCWC